MDDLELMLERLPDVVANLLEQWRMKSLEREKLEALLYLKFKGSGEKMTAEEIKALVRSDASRHAAMIEEIKAEAAYNQKYEVLMAAKKRASLRTAY